MCLTTNNPEIKVATKPIFCFKTGRFDEDGSLGGFNYNTSYKPNVVSPEVEIAFEQDGGNTVMERGYHSFTNYRKIRKAFYSGDTGIFVIPVGAKYAEGYYNNDEKKRNYVSSKIAYICPATFWNRLKMNLGLLKIN